MKKLYRRFQQNILSFGASLLAVAMVPLLVTVEIVPPGAVALTIAGGATISLAGCSAAQIENSVNTVLSSAEAIIKVADPAAPWLGSLASSIAALQQAEAQWKAGGPVAIIDSALNTVAAVLAVIPVTAVYAPLIGILVAGIEECLALIPQPTQAAQAAALTAHAMVASANPYHGRVALNKPHVFQSATGAYKAQWNATATALNLAQAKI
jgi:hypothetical protein